MLTMFIDVDVNLLILQSVMIHLIVLNFYDYLPQLSYFPNYVMMSLVGLCGAISLVGSLQVIYI